MKTRIQHRFAALRLATCSLIPIVAFLLDPPARAQDGKPIYLFNGRNLDGWYVSVQGRGRVADQNYFRVEDGVIRTYPDAADRSRQPFCGLITEASYHDYRLTLAYRWG